MITESTIEMPAEFALRAWASLLPAERDTVLKAMAGGRKVLVRVYYIGGSNYIAGMEESKC